MSNLDVIERLRRYNPVPEEPQAPPIAPLLERLADVRPLDDSVRWPRARARPRWKLALAVAGAGVAVLVVLALTGTPGGGTPNVAAAMYQVTTPGSGVLHMNTVTENTTAGQTNTINEQFWSAENPRRVRIIITVAGETLESALTTAPLKLLQWSQSNPNAITQSAPTGIASSEQTAVSVLRADYQKGEMTLAGKTTSNGQPAWVLEVHPPEPRPTLNGRPLPDPTVLVNATTFVPLEFVSDSLSRGSGGPQLMVSKVRYLAYEELPRNAQDEALLSLASHPGATLKNAP